MRRIRFFFFISKHFSLVLPFIMLESMHAINTGGRRRELPITPDTSPCSTGPTQTAKCFEFTLVFLCLFLFYVLCSSQGEQQKKKKNHDFSSFTLRLNKGIFFF